MFTASLGKQSFFDRQPVLNAVDRATRKVLSRFGGAVRLRAKYSIRKAPKVDVATGQRLGPGRKRKDVVTREAISDPGDPPFSHVGTVGKLIYYAYESDTKGVVIGPERFGKGTVSALEHGGTISIGPTRKRKGRRVTIAARPFMSVAFEAELKTMPPMWQGSVTD